MLEYIIIAVVAVLFLVFIVASCIKQNALRIKAWFNFRKLDIDKPMTEYAELLLDQQGLSEVKVVKTSFIASIFVGNTYNARNKVIRLGWWCGRRPTVTNLAEVSRMVGLAKMQQEGIRGIGTVEKLRWFSWVPKLFLPIIAVGFILDIVGQTGAFTNAILFTAVACAITLVYFIIVVASSKKQIKALTYGEEIIIGLGILDHDSEERKIKKLFVNWKRLVVAEVFISLFQFVYYLLKALLSMAQKKN